MKRYFSLLEILIALTLASILLTGLFGYYRKLHLTGELLQQSIEKVDNWRNLQARLSTIFVKVNGEGGATMNKKRGERYFYTPKDKNELIFTYDNGKDYDPRFSNIVLAKIFLDPTSKELFLLRWPLPNFDKENRPPFPFQKEILLENVERISFDFYDQNEWMLKKWPFDKLSPAPDFVRFNITTSLEKKDSLSFIFQLTNGKSHKITYQPQVIK